MKTFLTSLIALVITTTALAQAPTVKTMLELVSTKTEAQRDTILTKVGYAYKYIDVKAEYGFAPKKTKSYVPRAAVNKPENPNVVVTFETMYSVEADYRTTSKDQYELLLNSFKGVGFVADTTAKKDMNPKYVEANPQYKNELTFRSAKYPNMIVRNIFEVRDGKTYYFVHLILNKNR